MADYPISYAASAIKAGLSASAAYRAFQAGGGSMRRATWLKAYSEVKAGMSTQADEMTRPLDRRPLSGEMTRITFSSKSGYLQHAEIYVLNPDTGTVQRRNYSIATDDLLTRADVIETALSRFGQATGPEGSFPGERIIGAAYIGTHLMVPKES